VFVFEGDAFLNATALELVIDVRYPSTLDVDMPELMEFGEVIPITATLTGALGRISGASIVLTVTQDSVVQREDTLTTNGQGVASLNLVGLLSGNHTVTLTFLGSVTQAPSSVSMSLVITPVVVLDIEATSNLYLGHYCTVNLTVTVLGTDPGWSGTLEAWLSDPNGDSAGQWTFEIGVYSVVKIGFNATIVGTHVLNTTISGLPVVVSQDYPMSVTVINETLSLQLDAGTTPLLGGFGVLAAIGVVLRKKLKSVLGSLPGDWNN
jgi:hypothetical protein